MLLKTLPRVRLCSSKYPKVFLFPRPYLGMFHAQVNKQETLDSPAVNSLDRYLSWSCAYLRSIITVLTSTVFGFRAPSSSFTLSSCSLRFSLVQLAELIKKSAQFLPWHYTLLQSITGLTTRYNTARDRFIDRLPKGLFPFSVFPETCSNLPPGFPQPGLGSILRFSQPPNAFLHK